MDSYQFVRFLGQGNYGEVDLVKHHLEDKEYVCKKIKLHRSTPKERFAAEQEAKLLSQLKHINIVSYKQSFQYKESLYIIMQFCEGGDLHTWLKKRKSAKPLDESQVIVWFVQISLALQYLHGKNILHRDLKTQNIFLTHKNEIVKLGDLGIARQLNGAKDMAKTVIGTPYYMSPELYSNLPYNFKSDIWSLGCVVYEMCTSRQAFKAKDITGLIHKICTGQVSPLPVQYSTELSCLVTSMLEQEPIHRPSISEILKLKFIRSYLQSFIQRNRTNREKENKDFQSYKIKDQLIAEKLNQNYIPHIKHEDKNKSKRLSNSEHLSIIPTVNVSLKKEDEKQFNKTDTNRNKSMNGDNKDNNVRPSTTISSARKRRIEDKRKQILESKEIACSRRSSSSSTPSPTLEKKYNFRPLPPNPGSDNDSHRSSPISLNNKMSSPKSTDNRPLSPTFTDKRPLSPKFTDKRPPSPKFTDKRPPSPKFTDKRPPSPKQNEKSILMKPTVKRPSSPKERRNCNMSYRENGLHRTLSPTPSFVRSDGSRPDSPTPHFPCSIKPSHDVEEFAKKPSSVSTNPTNQLSKSDRIPPVKSKKVVKRRPLPPSPQLNMSRIRNQSEGDITNTVDDSSSNVSNQAKNKLKERLEQLKREVLPHVSKDILEKAYRLLDESDPDRAQVELVLLVGDRTTGLANKIIDLHFCEYQLKAFSHHTFYRSM